MVVFTQHNVKINIMKTSQHWIIQDWAGNHLFINETFDSFEDGWAYIQENVDNSKFEETQDNNDNEHQEYYVTLVKS